MATVYIQMAGTWQCPQCDQTHLYDNPTPKKGKTLTCTHCQTKHRVGDVGYTDHNNPQSHPITYDDLKIVTCVYCGHVYGRDDGTTPHAKAVLLTKHIAECEKHPMKVFVELSRKVHTSLVLETPLSENKRIELCQELNFALASLP